MLAFTTKKMLMILRRSYRIHR